MNANFNMPDADSAAQWESTWKEFDESTNKSLPQEDIRNILLLLGKDASASTFDMNTIFIYASFFRLPISRKYLKCPYCGRMT